MSRSRKIWSESVKKQQGVKNWKSEEDDTGSNTSSSDEESDSPPIKIKQLNIKRPKYVLNTNILLLKSKKGLLNKITKQFTPSKSSNEDSNSSSSDEESESPAIQIKSVNIHKPKVVSKTNIFLCLSDDEEETSSSSKDKSDSPCKIKKQMQINAPAATSGVRKKRSKKEDRPADPRRKRRKNEDNIEPESSSQLNPSLSNKYKKNVDDTLVQSVVENLAKDMKSVGVLISYGNPLGTVFRAGEKYAITAYHVIHAIPDRSLFRNKATFINFNESPLSPAKEIFTLQKLTFHDKTLDIAVLEVSNPEGLPKGLPLSSNDWNSNVSIIGYGHPSHPKKALDPCCTLVSPSSSRIVSAKKWLQKNNSYHRNALFAMERNPDIADNGLGELHDFNFFFDSFMEHGVSGAPSIAAAKDDSTRVIGVVTHGKPELYYLLPKLIKSGFPCEHNFAVGTKMEAIYASVLQKNPNLAKALFSS